MRKFIVIALVILCAGCFVLCAPKAADQNTVKTYVTVKAPGATIHKGEDMKAKNDFIGVIAPGVETEVLGQKIIAYKVAVPGKSEAGWIWAPLVEKMTNR